MAWLLIDGLLAWISHEEFISDFTIVIKYEVSSSFIENLSLIKRNGWSDV